MTPRREAEVFDRLIAESGEFNPFLERGWETLARRFAEAVPGRGLRVLDVGCGSGASSRVYRERAGSYIGLDLSLSALSVARRAAPERSWVRGDALALPVADASVDVVAFSSVLHHLEDRVAALGEARRALRPGGWVFAFDPNLRHPAMLLLRHPGSPFYRAEGVSPNERPLLPGTLRRGFRAAGFPEPRQRCQSDLPYRAVAVRFLRPFLGLYNAADRLWELTGLGRILGTFVLTWARKPA